MSTETIVSRLIELDKISKQLEIYASEQKDFVKEAAGFANNFISDLEHVKAFNKETKPGSSIAIDNKKKTLNQLLEIYKHDVVETGIKAASGKHLGYIPGGGIFSAAIADFIAAVSNPYAGVYYASPGAVAIENEVIRWLKSIFSFPETAVGNLASGGSVSTLIALTAARDKHQIKNEKINNSVVYLSKQVHHSTQKALRIIGLEDIIIRYIPLDENHRIKADALEALVVKDKLNGLNPFLVVGTAGTTDTGAVDPLDEIATIAAKYNLWFHADAAYGGFFIMTSKKEIFKGIERADSLIADPHKGMFLPYGLGAVLIKNKQAALHSNHYAANYMQDAEDDNLADSPANISPELSKHFRGLRLWLPLKIHGIEPFIACLEEKLLLIHYCRNKLIELGFKTGPEPDLSISYFWYPFEKESNKKNKQLMDEIHTDGDVFLSSSIINDQFVIRVAILSFRTKMATVDKAIEMIKRCLKKIN
ncbi:MAG: aminotransferase class V-fold PLP-dependent enzyme [Parafilimonas sp.]